MKRTALSAPFNRLGNWGTKTLSTQGQVASKWQNWVLNLSWISNLCPGASRGFSSPSKHTSSSWLERPHPTWPPTSSRPHALLLSLYPLSIPHQPLNVSLAPKHAPTSGPLFMSFPRILSPQIFTGLMPSLLSGLCWSIPLSLSFPTRNLGTTFVPPTLQFYHSWWRQLIWKHIVNRQVLNQI